MKPTMRYTPGTGWHEPDAGVQVTFTYGWVPMVHAGCPPDGCSDLCRATRAMEDARGCATNVPIKQGEKP